jgi:hypothetical protein
VIVLTPVEVMQLTLARARQKFMAEYCDARGWNGRELTVDQLLEIRAQRGWQVPEVR